MGERWTIEDVKEMVYGHKCKPMTEPCSCDITALEPDEDCPYHGWGNPKPRCRCGKFVARRGGDE